LFADGTIPAAFKVTESAVTSKGVIIAFVGARFVKAFNHLPSDQLGTNPSLPRQRQAGFVSSNDADASATVSVVATEVGSPQLSSEGSIRATRPFMF
jgi:predicted dinucleotide-binding enzyme